jgi:NDP-sugar pyrophosphorylase family protein/thiamine kinase-like enzyme
VEKINAFILAAGFGERLRPVTNYIPKPLLPVLGKSVIERVLERVTSLPIKLIGINMQYKSESLKDWINASSYSETIKPFYENAVLGTGGGLKNASQFLRETVFLVHNSDVLSNINLEMLVKEHLSSGNMVTLAVHDYKKFNNVWISEKGLLKYIGETPPILHKSLHQVSFTGIAIYSPEFLKHLPDGSSSVVDTWIKVVSSGFRIGTVDFTGCKWNDIGTPETYSSAIFELLKEEGETIYIHSSVDCRSVEIDGSVVVESDCAFEGSADLKNCIILPGSKIKDDAHIEKAIVGPDYRINIRQSQIMLNNINLNNSSISLLSSFFGKVSDNLEKTLIGTGGSDRKYYRMQHKEKTAILMECTKSDPDYNRHVTYAKFFRKHSVPVPELFGVDTEHTLSPLYCKMGNEDFVYALFEDLGDVSLYSWLKCRKEPERIEKLYKRVLDILINLHSNVNKNISECPLLQSRVFDYEYLRWETEYFTERFVVGVKGVYIKDLNNLNKEFESIARTADSLRKTVVHRDFQSQNIMVNEGDIPRLVDFQGARIGPNAYDISSILWDPYYRLEDEMRDRLLNYYVGKMKTSLDSNFDEDEFRQGLLSCRLQRHMQALGAYGFLSKVKGKTYFLKFVPHALQYLDKEIEDVRNEYPTLHALVEKLI